MAVVLWQGVGNFTTVGRELWAVGGAQQVNYAGAVAAAVAKLLRNPGARQEQAGAAARVASENADAVMRIHEEIAGLMNGE